MDDSASRTAPEPSPPRPTRARLLRLGLGLLALLLVVGAAWTRGSDDAANPQPTATVQAEDSHTSAASHADAESHGAETSAVDGQPMDMDEMDMDTQSMDEHQGDGHAEPTAHEAGEAQGLADEETSAPDGDHEEHGQAGGHEEAPPLSTATKQVVLSGFAGVNLLAIAAAALLRRRTPPRLPKHLAR